MIREQARASRWAVHSTRSSAIIKLLAMLTITSASWGPHKPQEESASHTQNRAASFTAGIFHSRL